MRAAFPILGPMEFSIFLFFFHLPPSSIEGVEEMRAGTFSYFAREGKQCSVCMVERHSSEEKEENSEAVCHDRFPEKVKWPKEPEKGGDGCELSPGRCPKCRPAIVTLPI